MIKLNHILAIATLGLVGPSHAEPEETVRHLFNINTVNEEMKEIIPGQLFFKHWNGEDISIGVFRMVRNEKGHFPGKINRHGEEVAVCTEGKFRMTIDGEVYYFGKGEALIIPPYMPHTGECLEESCTLLSWFTPHRLDEWGPENNADPELKFLDKDKMK
ncbi:MAG: cupin domain-containing protein [Gammaproteobacteria bacterium]|nr:cupin domain-containing protein [Gammaproteobacteria bacterium]